MLHSSYLTHSFPMWNVIDSCSGGHERPQHVIANAMNQIQTGNRKWNVMENTKYTKVVQYKNIMVI